MAFLSDSIVLCVSNGSGSSKKLIISNPVTALSDGDEVLVVGEVMVAKISFLWIWEGGSEFREKKKV